MGIYVYTLRKAIREIDGIGIGRYGYSFKVSSHRARNTDAKLAAADRALEAIGAELEHFIVGDFADVAPRDGKPLKQSLKSVAVWARKKDEEPVASFFDVPKFAEVVGYLVREGRKIRFVKQ